MVLHFTTTFDDAVSRGEIDSAPGLGFDSYRDPVARLLRHYYEEYVVDKMEPVLTEHEYVTAIPDCDRVVSDPVESLSDTRTRLHARIVRSQFQSHHSPTRDSAFEHEPKKGGCHTVANPPSEITFHEAKEAFLQYCRTKNLSPATLTHYTRRLSGMITFLNNRHPGLSPSGVDLTHLRERVAAMMDAEADTTSINHYVTVTKTFFAFLAEEGYIPSNPAARLKKLKDERLLIKTFSQEQMEALLAQPSKLRFAGPRDYLLMLLLLDTGLRIAEAMDIKLSDIDRASSTVVVMGKGSKERSVHFGLTVRRALLQYLERRGDLDTDYLFVTEYGHPMQVGSDAVNHRLAAHHYSSGRHSGSGVSEAHGLG